MSKEQARQFISNVKSDPELAKRIGQTESAEEKLAIAKSQGYEVSLEDFRQILDEIPDDELEVAGGKTRCYLLMIC
jgi:predicted ribosomally synthesized peptide with nif11-like leader